MKKLKEKEGTIEGLQKENQRLTEEKERLVEENGKLKREMEKEKEKMKKEKKETEAAKFLNRYFKRKLIELGEEKEEITREGLRIFNTFNDSE